MYRLSWNMGVSPSWNPQGLSRAAMGLLYQFHEFPSWNMGVSPSWNPQGLSRAAMGLLYQFHEFPKLRSCNDLPARREQSWISHLGNSCRILLLWNSGNKAQEIYGAVNLTVFIITEEVFEKTIRRKDVEIICDLKYIKFIVRVWNNFVLKIPRSLFYYGMKIETAEV